MTAAGWPFEELMACRGELELYYQAAPCEIVPNASALLNEYLWMARAIGSGAGPAALMRLPMKADTCSNP
jgi:hypothetical protein